MTADLKKRADESELNYIWRLGKLRDDGVIDMTWSELAEILNSQLREPDEEYTESAYRKKYKTIKDAYDEIFSSYKEDNYIQELTLQRQELQKEQRKLRDERLDLNKRLREQARLESTIERIENSLNNIADQYYNTKITPSQSPITTDKMIVCLSDLHIGGCWENSAGQYNTDIAKKRLNKYLNEIFEIKKRNGCEECNLVLLGDLINGSLKTTISITNKENVIDQIKIASLLISDFADVLSQHFRSVIIYSVAGNHSRIEKKAEDALLGERLDNLIPWFLENILKNNHNIKVISHTFDDTLGITKIGNQIYFFQHGDYSSINESSISKLILWAKQVPYCILTGHMHHDAMMNISNVHIIQSGSLCGSGDEYTRSKRLTGNPSQTVIVTNEEGFIHGVYPVELL